MADDKITTIKLLWSTKERLDKIRIHRRETYDEILQRVLSILNLTRADPERAQGRLRLIERRHKLSERKKKIETRKDENSQKNIWEKRI